MNSVKNSLKRTPIFKFIVNSYGLVIIAKRLLYLDFFFIRKFLNKKNFLVKISLKGKILYSKKLTSVYASLTTDNSPYPQLHNYKELTQYALELKNVQIIGSSHLVILDKNDVLYDYVFLEDSNIRYTDAGIIYHNNKHCFIDKIFSDLRIKSGIALHGNFSYNYCHFLIEILSRFEILNDLKIDKNVPIILDKICFDQSQYRELIALFNTDNRALVYIEPRHIYNIEKLYYVSSPNFIAPDLKDFTRSQITSGILNPENLSFLTETMTQHIGKGTIKKRVFISRKNVSVRRAYNEVEVKHCLERFGFETFFPEEHSIEEQVFVFKNAEIIVAASGAALTNLMFCTKFCKVIFLTSYPFTNSFFYTIAGLVGFKFYLIHDENLLLSKNSDIQDAFSISIIELESLLKSFNL